LSVRVARRDEKSNISTCSAVIYIERNGKELKAMQGIVIFKSMGEAQNCGFQYFDRTEDGFLVRKMTPKGWALALARDED
jgi:hypothetical protein